MASVLESTVVVGRAKRNSWLDRALLACVTLLLVDLALFGPGLVIPIVSLSLRRVLFVGILGLIGLRHLLARVGMTRSEVLLLLGIALQFAVWVAGVPTIFGFRSADSIADALPWLSLVVLVFWPWDAWPQLAQWRAFNKLVVGLAVTLAMVHIVIWALVRAEIISTQMLGLATQALSGSEPDSDSFIKVAISGEGEQYRVYWSSSIFMLGGLYFLIVNHRTGKSLRWFLQLLVILLALWVTQIRAFLAAALIVILMGPVLRHMKILRNSGNSRAVALLIWVTCVLGVSAALSPEFLQWAGIGRSESDLARVEQAGVLLQRFQSYPLLGTGFGSFINDVIRATDAPFSYELVFYALLMKVGLLGILVLLAILYFALTIVRLPQLAATDPDRYCSWVALTAGFWFAGATNPIAVNFVGMGVFVLLLMDARQSTNHVGDAC
jgi:hypothetical protein